MHEAGRASWQISTDQPQPLAVGCSSATLRGCPPAITGCRPLRRLSRAPATRLQRRRGCNGTTGGTKPCGRSVKRTTGTGHLTSAPGGPHPPSSLFMRRPNSRRSSPRTSSTPSAGATPAIKSMARPCTAASERCSRQGLSETWNVPGRGKLSRSTCGSPRSQSRDSRSGSSILTTSWSLPLCCGTPLNTSNASDPSSRHCSDRYDVTSPSSQVDPAVGGVRRQTSVERRGPSGSGGQHLEVTGSVPARADRPGLGRRLEPFARRSRTGWEQGGSYGPPGSRRGSRPVRADRRAVAPPGRSAQYRPRGPAQWHGGGSTDRRSGGGWRAPQRPRLLHCRPQDSPL